MRRGIKVLLGLLMAVTLLLPELGAAADGMVARESGRRVGARTAARQGTVRGQRRTRQVSRSPRRSTVRGQRQPRRTTMARRRRTAPRTRPQPTAAGASMTDEGDGAIGAEEADGADELE